MNRTLSFAAGFAAGWLARSAFESSHDAVVDVAGFVAGAWQRLRRVVAVEREHFEDLAAEIRARASGRRDERESPGATAAPVSQNENGAVGQPVGSAQ